MGKEATRSRVRRRPDPSSAALADGQILHVWLFGSLSKLAPKQPTVLSAPDGARVGWAIDELARRIGPAFRDQVMETPTRKFGFCRVFLDGRMVELEDRLPAVAAPQDLELIILTAAEGG